MSRGILCWGWEEIGAGLWRPGVGLPYDNMETRVMKRTFWMCLCAAVTVSGCKTPVELSLFTSDVLAVEQTGTPLEASAVVRVNTGTQAKCLQHSAAIEAAMRQGFLSATFIECRQESFDSFALIRITLPITRKADWVESAGFVWVERVEDVIRVAASAGPAKYQQIVATLPAEIKDYATAAQEFEISLTLQNDLPDTATIRTYASFVDGQPYQLPRDIELARRGELSIRLSDVSNARVGSGGSLLFAVKTP
jgi:hypothetical protein